jgi:hypothetical protein
MAALEDGRHFLRRDGGIHSDMIDTWIRVLPVATTDEDVTSPG